MNLPIIKQCKVSLYKNESENENFEDINKIILFNRGKNINYNSKNPLQTDRKILRKFSPYNFQYFFVLKNKKALLSLREKNRSDSNLIKKNMGSEVKSLMKESNIYTSNANYIKNKKLLLFDRDYNLKESSSYFPDVLKRFNFGKNKILNKINKELIKSPLFKMNKSSVWCK